MGKGAAPATLIIAGGLAADVFLAGAAFAALGLIAAVILAAVVLGIYAKGLAEAAHDREWLWLLVMAVTPVAGAIIGYLIGTAAEPPMVNPHYHFNVLHLVAILAGLYGVFGGWWIAPVTLRESSGPLAALIALVSFASTSYVWTMIDIAVNHGKSPATTGFDGGKVKRNVTLAGAAAAVVTLTGCGSSSNSNQTAAANMQACKDYTAWQDTGYTLPSPQARQFETLLLSSGSHVGKTLSRALAPFTADATGATSPISTLAVAEITANTACDVVKASHGTKVTP